MQTGVVFVFQSGFAQFINDILGAIKGTLVFMEKFPYFLCGGGPPMDAHYFFNNSDPTITTTVAPSERSACERLTIIHIVFIYRSFQTALAANDRMTCVNDSFVSAFVIHITIYCSSRL